MAGDGAGAGGFVEVDLAAADTRAERRSRWRHVVLALVVLTAMAALLAGVAFATRTVPREDVTIVLVIDVSGSMTADDVAPDRITAARRAAREFVTSLPPTLRIGLIAFSSHVRVLAAPTRDRTEVLEGIDGLAAAGGTAMGDAINTAIELVRGQDQQAPLAGPASVLLISDGANTVGHVQPLEAAGQANELDVPIYTVSLGTATGQALIPDAGGGYRRETVPPDLMTLSAVAALTDGRLYKAPTAGDLTRVYNDIGVRLAYREETTRWPLAAGVALLVVAGGLSLVWRTKLR